MAKLEIHGKPERIEELKDELPKGVSWIEYLLEAVTMRKKVEGRQLVLKEPDE